MVNFKNQRSKVLKNTFNAYVLERMKECLTLTYIPFHVTCCSIKILYVYLLITDYLIGLAF